MTVDHSLQPEGIYQLNKKQILTINHPIQADKMHQLKEPSLTEIRLEGVCVGHLKNDYFVKDFSILITIETINPAVEVLSLKCCGLTDDHVKGITAFKMP